MTIETTKKLRCAIYTRKSTEHGLELEFNSLDAQREACEAYIKSQVHEGWQIENTRYDDPAYSGGNLERPALQRLLKDIDAGQIDIIVVYKIDRLTRSLSDFAKLVDAFDAKSISFVAVTQQFNTTTSMGRLTLNVLLSFAQFERELSSERVRDKIAASRKKGKWTGGGIPLGYVNRNKKLIIEPHAAQLVRMIFDCYLELRSIQKVIDELARHPITAKIANKTNKRPISLTYGPLAYLLKNRIYVGEIAHKERWFPGEHEPIISQDVFEAAQKLLQSRAANTTGKRTPNNSLLGGMIFDDNGNRMSPSFTVKKGVRYSFYVSGALLKGKKSEAGSATRVSMIELDQAVASALAIKLAEHAHNQNVSFEIIRQHIERATVGAASVTIALKKNQFTDELTIVVPWRSKLRKSTTSIEETSMDAPAIDHKLVQAVARSHAWRQSLQNGSFESVESLAAANDVHPKVVRKLLRLAFLEPTTIRAIFEGTQPAGMTIKGACESAGLAWNSHI